MVRLPVRTVNGPKEPLKVHGRNAEGKPICDAKTTDGQRRCQSGILYPNGRCRKHGGASLSGAAHPSFKGNPANRSELLPKKLRQFYNASLARGADQVNLEQEIALVDANIGRLLYQLREGTKGGEWRLIVEEGIKLRAALDKCKDRSVPPDEVAQTEIRASVWAIQILLGMGEHSSGKV